MKDMKTHRESERDAILRHYIKTHPDDFPAPGIIELYCNCYMAIICKINNKSLVYFHLSNIFAFRTKNVQSSI